jgi:thiosulfate/3-mercaptopyruvate sulfurtransferase
MSNTPSFHPNKTTSSALLSAEDLLSSLDSDSLKIFDVRGTWKTPARALYQDYLEGHIPGAIFIDWTKDFLEQNCTLNLASVSDLQRAELSFKKLGINKHDLVVIYDDYHHMFAGRIWWAMKYLGFENVKVLNGGWKKWTASTFPISTEIPTVDPGSYKPQQENKWRVDLDDFISKKEMACVLDARGNSNYAGKKDEPRSGHIPGAINLPYHLFLDAETGLFLEPANIKDIFDKHIHNWHRCKIISSCGSGYVGTVVILALMELGVNASLFDGSFAVWRQDISRNVEQS